MRGKGVVVNFDVLTLLIKINQTSYEEYYGKFNITEYFVRIFIKDCSYKYFRLHGESLSADLSKIYEFKGQFLRPQKKFQNDCIYNVDETAIRIKGIVSHSYSTKGVENKSIKKYKTIFSLLLRVNMEGEKVVPLLI